MAEIQLEHVTKVFDRQIEVFGVGRGARTASTASVRETLGYDTPPDQPMDDEEANRRAVAENARTKGITVTGGTKALDDVSLTVHDGETISVVGPSGCGKSTLLRVIAGLEPTTGGRVLYDGQDMAETPPKDRGIGMVFQSYALYPHMKSKGNLAFFFKMHKREEEIDERVRITSEIMGVGFEALLDRNPRELSGGQKQRVAIGRCIVRNPRLFLFDEPLSNLDAKLRTQTRIEIKRLLRRFKITSVYVTHDQTEAIVLADRIAVMRHGLIEQVGTYWEVMDNPANKFVAGFLGLPPMNFFAGEVQGSQMVFSGFTLPIDAQAQNRLRERTKFTLGLRPDWLAARPSPGWRSITGQVEVVEHLFSDRSQLVYMDVGGEKLVAKLDDPETAVEGDTITLYFDPGKCCLFDAETEERLVA